MSDLGTDNINEPIPNQEGKYIRVEKKDIKVIHRPCEKHDMVIDPTEKSNYWQGYQCKNCGMGRLRKL